MKKRRILTHGKKKNNHVTLRSNSEGNFDTKEQNDRPTFMLFSPHWKGTSL